MDVIEDGLDARAWDAAVSAHGAGLQQSWSYGDVAETLGAETHRFVLRDKGKDVAYAQALVRRWGVRVALVSGGPVWAGGARDDTRALAIRILRQTLRSRTKVQLVTPDRVDRWGLPLVSSAHAARLSLSGNINYLRGNLNVKWRNRLTRAETQGLRVRPGDAACLEWLLAQEAQQRRTRGYRGLPVRFLAEWCRDLTRFGLWEVRASKTRVAAILVGRHGAGVTYLCGHTTPLGRSISAHNMLIWRAIKDMAEAGSKYLDLGLVETETGAGLARFKLGTGAKVTRFGSTQLSF